MLIGTFVGVLPGIGPAMALALLLPITYGLDATQSLIMFAGIYYGAMYGGSTTSILLNTPGESASVMTAIEGNKMAKKGRAAQALATAAIGSFIAGTIATLLVALFAPSIAEQAVKIGAPSFFAIMLLSLVLVTGVLGTSKLRGFIGLFIGLTIGLIGLDLSTGQARLTGGDHRSSSTASTSWWSRSGCSRSASRSGSRRTCAGQPIDVIPVGRPFMGREDWSRSWKPWLRGTALGFPFGALPAGGAETPTFLSYITEKKLAQAQGRVRQRRDRGGRRTRGGQQRQRGRHVRAAAALGLPVTATASILLAAMKTLRHRARTDA